MVIPLDQKPRKLHTEPARHHIFDFWSTVRNASGINKRLVINMCPSKTYAIPGAYMDYGLRPYWGSRTCQIALLSPLNQQRFRLEQVAFRLVPHTVGVLVFHLRSVVFLSMFTANRRSKRFSGEIVIVSESRADGWTEMKTSSQNTLKR